MCVCVCVCTMCVLCVLFLGYSFDGAYAIEATCHAPQREGVYSEIYRVLKPGAYFAMYEWCLTPQYDASNAEHREVKKKIEEGDGLPDMARTTEIDEAIASAFLSLLLVISVDQLFSFLVAFWCFVWLWL